MNYNVLGNGMTWLPGFEIWEGCQRTAEDVARERQTEIERDRNNKKWG